MAGGSLALPQLGYRRVVEVHSLHRTGSLIPAIWDDSTGARMVIHVGARQTNRWSGSRATGIVIAAARGPGGAGHTNLAGAS